MFTEYLAEVKITKSAETWKLYSFALQNFPKGGTREEILNFIESSPAKETTKKLYLKILGNALEFYNKRTKDIDRLIKGYRCNKPVEPCPTRLEVEKLWRSLKKPRDKLIFGLMAYNGLRVSEVCNLTVDDILPDNRILLRDTKGKQDCIVPIVHSRVKIALEEWLKIRNSTDKALFTTHFHKAMTLGSMKLFITRRCRKVGLPYHPHSFRRFFGNTLSRAGVPIQNICVAMRHKNIATTMGYLNINQEDTKSILETIYTKEESLYA